MSNYRMNKIRNPNQMRNKCGDEYEVLNGLVMKWHKEVGSGGEVDRNMVLKKRN